MEDKYLGNAGLSELASIIKSITGAEATQLTNQDLNSVVAFGLYYTSGQDTVTHKPVDECYNNIIQVTAVPSGTKQEFYCMSINRSYERSFINNAWTDWKALLNDSDVGIVSNTQWAAIQALLA